MPKFQFPKSILSRPVYGVLKPRPGSQHLMIADGAGGAALLELVGSEMIKSAHIIYISNDKEGSDFTNQLRALNPAQFYAGPSFAAALPRLNRTLLNTRMGLQVYLAGSEGLIGQAEAVISAAGVSREAIQTEHRGGVGRRMQCVHCKGFTEDVLVDPFVCSHCGLNLYVRDHYSRRLAAFQAVCVDAEDPGNVPESKELYP